MTMTGLWCVAAGMHLDVRLQALFVITLINMMDSHRLLFVSRPNAMVLSYMRLSAYPLCLQPAVVPHWECKRSSRTNACCLPAIPY